MGILVSQLHMFPPGLNNDLHLIDKAKAAGLRLLCFRSPLSQLHPYDLLLEQTGCSPPQYATPPQRSEDLEWGQYDFRRVYVIMRGTVVADSDIGVEEHALACGERVVGVYQAALRRFDM